MIKKMHHGCIGVSDMDEAVAFYRDKLGLTKRLEAEIYGEEFEALFGQPGFRARLVYFEEGVELGYAYCPSDGKPVSSRPWDFGATFLVFEVEDLDKTYADLVAKGVKFFGPPRLPSVEAPTVGSIKVAHLRGPDGVRISLTEVVKGSWEKT